MRTCFTILADVHFESNNPERFRWFGDGLRDINAADEKSRALVFLGDNTMNGNIPETILFFGLLQRWNKIDNVFIAAGNHDLCSEDRSDEKYAVHEKRLMRTNNAFLSNKLERLYYSAVVDGCRFIFLSSDHDAGTAQFLSEEQFIFLEKELALASADKRPAFIFSHWPITHIENGQDMGRLLSLLKNCSNKIFYFSGHLHRGISQNCYGMGEMENVTFINVPAFGAVNSGDDEMLVNIGMGYNVQVYDEEIVIRTRNYFEHKWTDIEYRFPCKYQPDICQTASLASGDKDVS